MDYFNDVPTTFLGLERGSCVAVRKLSDFIKNILICVPKINKGLTHVSRIAAETDTEKSIYTVYETLSHL